MTYDATRLLARAGSDPQAALINSVTPARAGWDFITFEARRLAAGAGFAGETGESEMAIVMLTGTATIAAGDTTYSGVGRRRTVFEGPPYAVYLPRRTRYSITADTAVECALAWSPTDQDHPAQLVTPAQVGVELRGGDNASRQINSIIPPGFNCHRLVIVEVYTPGGNWSSYPPHKHDVHRLNPDGSVLEADLEEIYYFRFDRPEGYAYQRVYTAETSPLQRSGQGFDALVMPRQDDVVIIPEGYHPVASPPGYTAYYLNVLAGSAQSLANCEDPAFAWVRGNYKGLDSRVPLYK